MEKKKKKEKVLVKEHKRHSYVYNGHDMGCAECSKMWINKGEL